MLLNYLSERLSLTRMKSVFSQLLYFFAQEKESSLRMELLNSNEKRHGKKVKKGFCLMEEVK